MGARYPVQVMRPPHHGCYRALGASKKRARASGDGVSLPFRHRGARLCGGIDDDKPK